MSNTHHILFLLAFSAYIASADVFTSIDCGSSDTYTDDKLIVWMGDDTLINNGLSQTVQTKNSFSPVMASLRVFTTRKKNCYTIEVTNVGQVLVRASFFYGNYDKKSSPPTFDLHLDGDHWTTVETSTTDVVYYEAIYPVAEDLLSVCVAQTKPNQLPFISALEVRSLDSNMYSHMDAGLALFSNSRVAYGTKETIRYVDDAYDRIWDPAQVGDGLIQVQNDAIFITTTDVEDSPPQAVLKNAITSSTTSEFISLDPKFPSKKTLIYIAMYFSEVTQLDSTQKRSFRIYQNNESISDVIEPTYGDVIEYAGNLTASSDTVFSVRATGDSTLPPLVNAMEVYYISNPLTDGTNGDDVKGLSSLLTNFQVLQEWSGTEPCLPATFTWDWLTCSSDSTPRVTSLDLSSFGLSGSLPDFSTMAALEKIDLHNNSLYGPIPDFLGTLPNLKELNLADNQFSGPIPTSLSKNNKIKLVVTGNPNVCASGKSCQVLDSPASNGSPTTYTTTTKKSKNKLPVILGVTIPIFIIFWVVVAVLAIFKHKRKSAAFAAAGAGAHNQQYGTPQSQSSMLGRFGEAMADEMKENIEQGNVNIDFSNQTDQHQSSAQGNGQ